MNVAIVRQLCISRARHVLLSIVIISRRQPMSSPRSSIVSFHHHLFGLSPRLLISWLKPQCRVILKTHLAAITRLIIAALIGTSTLAQRNQPARSFCMISSIAPCSWRGIALSCRGGRNNKREIRDATAMAAEAPSGGRPASAPRRKAPRRNASAFQLENESEATGDSMRSVIAFSHYLLAIHFRAARSLVCTRYTVDTAPHIAADMC